MPTEIEFRNLRLQAAHLLGADEPGRFADIGELIDEAGQLELILEDAAGDLDAVCCRVELGPIEEPRRLEVFEDLLAMNMELAGHSEGMFCFNRESGHVVLSMRVDADRFSDAPAMAEYIRMTKELGTELKSRWGSAAVASSPTD